LRSNLWVPIDKKGYSANYAEGALGCVVEVRGTEAEEVQYALKLPRLMADTDRENAYINQLMEDEHRNVAKIFGVIGARRGLIPAAFAIEPIFKAQVNAGQGRNQEARSVEGHLVLVRFERGRGPRFCSVGIGVGDELAVFPPATKSEIAAYIDPNSLREILENLRFRDDTVVLRRRSGPDGTGDGARPAESGGESLPTSIGKHHGIDCWYALIPSVLYRWATQSLQQSLDSGLDWKIDDHLVLIRQILNGVQTLHEYDLLHADLRPANIMCEGASAVAENYVLIDYASFGTERQGQDRSVHGGDTNVLVPFKSSPPRRTLGPSTIPQRSSPFYAPERRAGNDDESADTAVIRAKTRVEGDKHEVTEYLVVFGWKSELFATATAQENGQDVYAWKHAIDQVDKSSSTDDDERRALGPGEPLQPGDRIRLREHVLDVQRVRTVDVQVKGLEGRAESTVTLRALVCGPHIWRVHHDRIVVLAERDEFGLEPTVLSLPRVVPLRRVSAATDMYAVGAILLYSLLKVGTWKGRASGDGAQGGEGVTDDELFVHMLSTLESARYQEAIGGRLERMRNRLYEVALTPEFPGPNWHTTDFDASSNTKQSVLDQVSTDVDFIISTTPGAEHVLRSCNENSAIFVLVLHFALSCVARRTNLPKDRWQMLYAPKYMPFCESRMEPTRRDGGDEPAGVRGAVVDAQHRLRELQVVLNRGIFGKFGLQTPAGRPYESALAVRLRAATLETRIRKLEAAVEKVVDARRGWFQRWIGSAELEQLRNARGASGEPIAPPTAPPSQRGASAAR
jgi:serine/threonine protein kinase